VRRLCWNPIFVYTNLDLLYLLQQQLQRLAYERQRVNHLLWLQQQQQQDIMLSPSMTAAQLPVRFLPWHEPDFYAFLMYTNSRHPFFEE
jgi:hypothetical protein